MAESGANQLLGGRGVDVANDVQVGIVGPVVRRVELLHLDRGTLCLGWDRRRAALKQRDWTGNRRVRRNYLHDGDYI